MNSISEILNQHFQMTACLLRAKDIDALQRRYLTPLVVYLFDEYLMINSDHEMRELISQMVERYVRDDIRDISFDIVDHAPRRNACCTVRLVWRFHYLPDAPDLTMCTIYTMRINPEAGSAIIEMIELTDDLPEEMRDLTALWKHRYSVLENAPITGVVGCGGGQAGGQG